MARIDAEPPIPLCACRYLIGSDVRHVNPESTPGVVAIGGLHFPERESPAGECVIDARKCRSPLIMIGEVGFGDHRLRAGKVRSPPSTTQFGPLDIDLEDADGVSTSLSSVVVRTMISSTLRADNP